jgi:hypothetical protein
MPSCRVAVESEGCMRYTIEPLDLLESPQKRPCSKM